jgi:hypothetical protein
MPTLFNLRSTLLPQGYKTMQDYLITFTTKPAGTFSYVMTGYASKAEAIANATYMARTELGRDFGRMKEARLYNGKGYVCKW